MHCDGILHKKEKVAIKDIALHMGLNPNATNRVLKAMEVSPTGMISPDFLLKVFHEQLN
jgi:hypothetical protein